MTEDSGAVTETVPCDLVRKATEALAKDVGRGLARLDPADMSLTGIAPGDVIRLTGKRATVAKAMPAFPKDRGNGIVQIDGVTRHNAGTSLGERAAAAAHRLPSRQEGQTGAAHRAALRPQRN